MFKKNKFWEKTYIYIIIRKDKVFWQFEVLESTESYKLCMGLAEQWVSEEAHKAI